MATQVLSGSPAEIVSGNNIPVSDNNPITVIVTGLAGAEVIDLQISYDGGTNFVDVISDGSAQQFSTTSTVMTLNGPGIYRLNKDAVTVGTITGYVASSWSP